MNHDSVLLALQRATHVTLHVLATRLAGLGLTPAEINALANLPSAGGLTVSELAGATGSKPSTATSVLDRLEGRALVRRDPRPGDRRTVLVTLTPAGRKAAKRVSRAVAAVEQEALAGLSASSVRGLMAGLRALAEVAG